MVAWPFILSVTIVPYDERPLSKVYCDLRFTIKKFCDKLSMASYDSDSSGAEDDAYTETNVLLGYASKEPTDDTISQLGGHPVR